MIKELSKFILAIVVISILGYGFWLAYEPWFKLSEFFGSKLNPPEIFFEQQSCILGETRVKGYFQVGATRLKSYVNVGLTENKLYLSHTSPLSYIIKPLLIDLDVITKIESDFNSLLNECYKFSIGEPTITTLILSKVLIEKLEEEYGEPIFSNKLDELN